MSSRYDAWLTSNPMDMENLCPHCGEQVDEDLIDWQDSGRGAQAGVHACGAILWLYDDEPGPLTEQDEEPTKRVVCHNEWRGSDGPIKEDYLLAWQRMSAADPEWDPQDPHYGI